MLKTKDIVNATGIISMTGGACLILWWVLMPVVLPVADAADNFQNMVLHAGWIPVNLVGLIAVLLLILSY